MPKTLLAVDDSATMRKVLEITFSGDDFRVVTADGQQTALAKMSEDTRVVLIDTTLGGDDGYALCKEIRKRSPSAALLLLASRHNPYDQAKGRDAGADDYMDKPFDTQQMVDKVRKLLLTKEGGASAQVAAPAAAQPAPAPPQAPPMPAAQQRPAAPGYAQQPQPPQQQPPTPGARPAISPPTPATHGRAHTLMFGEDKPAAQAAPPPAAPPQQQPATPKPPQAEARPSPQARPPQPAPHAPPHTQAYPPTHAAASHAAASTAVNGQLAGKLNDLGLSPAQADAVMALSRELVERVVWEVVPQLAETLIREEIARLMKEG